MTWKALLAYMIAGKGIELIKIHEAGERARQQIKTWPKWKRKLAGYD